MGWLIKSALADGWGGLDSFGVLRARLKWLGGSDHREELVVLEIAGFGDAEEGDDDAAGECAGGELPGPCGGQREAEEGAGGGGGAGTGETWKSVRQRAA